MAPVAQNRPEREQGINADSKGNLQEKRTKSKSTSSRTFNSRVNISIKKTCTFSLGTIHILRNQEGWVGEVAKMIML